MELYTNLPPLLKTFWLIALPSSLIFLIQTILTFMGADATDGLDADFDGDLSDTEGPHQLFSFRNLIHFLLGFSWAGISFYSSIQSSALLILLALVVGLAFLFLFFLVIQQIQKLAEDNSFQFTNTIGNSGEVYLIIPGYKKGTGKVLISVNGSTHELLAMTEGETIETGSMVIVERLENKQILIVKKIS
jgi:hypothetical protein